MILWLTPYSGGKGLLGGIQAVLKGALQKGGVKPSDVMFNSLHFKTPTLREHDDKKMPDKQAVLKARKNLDDDIKILRPSLIVVNDEDTLRVITEKKYTLATTRGSVYYYRSIPCIVIDDYNVMKFKDYAQFQFELDLAKIARWATGRQKNEPAFDFHICRTVNEVNEFCLAASNATLVAEDIETANGFTTSIAFTYDDRAGKLKSFTIPFFDPFANDGGYWSEADQIAVFKIIRTLQQNKVFKGYQNGTYDCAYQIKEGIEPVNYLFDSQNLMHSIWVEVPKALHNIASCFVDHYTYWKDESKGAKEDGFGRGREGLEQYWRYNGLDSYYTFLSIASLVSRIRQLPWALKNYNSEFSLSIGPCLAASLRGIRVDRQRHASIMAKQFEGKEAGIADLRRLSGEDDFNPNSPKDVAWLLYDVMGAAKTRLQRKGSKYGVRSTDEKVLMLMNEQPNAFLRNAIKRILAAKKPSAVLSKYGNYNEFVYRNNRFLSWHNAASTETYRLNSTNSQFWTGTNAQNLQPFIQEMFVADPDYVFLDVDYSASDDWFIAHEAEDEDKITSLRTKDTHSYHAATFFKLDYDKVVQGKKRYEAWVVDAIKGVRQIAKKFNHGKNFRMGATMTYNLMGRDMAVATARLMGYKNPEGMSDKELIGMCEVIGDMYDHPKRGLYKRIRAWQDETVAELKERHGLATNAHGITRSFLKSADDHAVQRALSAYFGQSGTSGNANRALRKIFYTGVDDGRTCLFLLQVHDSFKFLIHKSALGKIEEIKRIMEEPITLKGRTFFVPVNAEVGLTDGKHMLPWRPDITYEEIVAHEHKEYDAKFPKGNDAILNMLGNISLDGAAFDEEAFAKELDRRFGDDLMDMSNNDENSELVEE